MMKIIHALPNLVPNVPGLLIRVLLFGICCSVFYHSRFAVRYSAAPRSAFRVLQQPLAIPKHGVPSQKDETKPMLLLISVGILDEFA